MRAMRRAGLFLARFQRAQSGETAIEYALIAVVISIVIVTTVGAIGANLRVNYFERVQAETRE